MKKLMLFSAALWLVFALSGESYAKEKKCSYKNPPTSSVELLQNILCLTKNYAQIEAGYFSDDIKLGQLTGGKSFFRSDAQNESVEQTFVTYFPKSIDPDTTLAEKRLSIDFIKKYKPSELKIRLHKAQGGLMSFGDIQKLLGSYMKQQSFTPTQQAHMGEPNPDYPHSLEKLEYWYSVSATNNAKILVDFDERGRVAVIDITLSESIVKKPILPWQK